jgi:hypothetical protein
MLAAMSNPVGPVIGAGGWKDRSSLDVRPRPSGAFTIRLLPVPDILLPILVNIRLDSCMKWTEGIHERPGSR